MKKVIFTLIFLAFTTNCFAQDRETLKEKFIGIMVKTFAKTYIATTNLKKFNEKNIRKIKKMDEQKFQRVYAKIYREMIIDLPEPVRETYGATEHMTREKAIAQINTFKNKKRIYKLINAIPNKLIAKQFVQHREEIQKTMKDNNVDRAIDHMLADPTPVRSL